MVHPGVASTIRRPTTSLAPLESVNVRELLLESQTFGPEQVERLRRAMAGDQLAVARQCFAELRDQAEAEKPDRRALIVAGVLAYLLGQHQLAAALPEPGLRRRNRRLLPRPSSCWARNNIPRPPRRSRKRPRTVLTRFSAGSSKAGAIRLSGRLEEAEKLLRESAREGATRAEYSHQMGCIRADYGDIFGAIEYFERAVDMDPHHTAALFRLANEMNLLGNDTEAIRLYEQALSRPPFYVSALINLGLLYEDTENYPAAAFCFRRVLQFHPNHQRAQLYLKDIEAAGNMYYDEDAARQQRELEQVMRIPIC